MSGDQASAGDTVIDVFTHRGGHIVHKQVERRGGRTYLRIRKRSVMSLIRE